MSSRSTLPGSDGTHTEGRGTATMDINSMTKDQLREERERLRMEGRELDKKIEAASTAAAGTEAKDDASTDRQTGGFGSWVESYSGFLERRAEEMGRAAEQSALTSSPLSGSEATEAGTGAGPGNSEPGTQA
ncbi:hypothetical protein IAU59_007101 [Kwoniella sp. CBS 9459]